MKRCPRCERTHPETDSECPYCRYREEEPAQVAAHIDFLLGEIPQWVNRSWLDRDKAALLWDVYTRRRASLRPAGAPTAPLVVARPPLVVQKEAPPAPAPPARRAHPLAAFLEERNISYWHLVGAVLLLAGLSGLVRYTWDTTGKYLVFVLMIAVTAGFYALGGTLTRQGHQVTGWALRAVALLLVPLDLIAINAFALSGLHLLVNTIGLITAGVCLPLYAWRAVRERLRCFDVLVTLDLAATLHFALQTILPHVISAHTPYAAYGAYGFFYLPVALAYFVAAWRSATPERRMTWLVCAHAMALGSLALAIWPEGGRTLGDSTATVLLAAVLYTATAFMLDEPLYPWLSSVLGFAGVALAVSRHGAAPWYWYALLAQAVAYASIALCRLHLAGSRNQTASGYSLSGWVLAVISLILQALALFAGFEYFPHFAVPRPDLYGATACATFSTRFLLWLTKRPFITLLVAYLFVLAGLVIGCLLPHGVAWHDSPQIGLPLGLAALVFLVTVRGRRSAIIAGFASLLISCLYAAGGYSYGFTLFTLALVIAVMAIGSAWRDGDVSPLERQAMLWGGAGAAVTGALLWETRLLPFLHAHLRWEENYAYALVPLVALAVAHGSYWRSRNERLEEGMAPYQIAGVIGVFGALMQLFDSLAGMPYSPLAILGLGTIAAGAYAVRYRSQIAAGCAALLVLLAYLAYLLYLGRIGITSLIAPPPLSADTQTLQTREAILIAILLGSCALFAAFASRTRTRSYVAFTVLAGVAGVLYGIHMALHPAMMVYSLALLPVAALLSTAAYMRPRQATDLWHAPLRDMSLILSLFALLPAASHLFGGPSPTLDPLGLWCLLGYGLLWAGVAVASRELHYVYLSAFAVSAAYLYGLDRYVHSTSVVGFDLAIGALAWAGAAILLALTAKIKEETTLALHHVATALIFIALGFALFGDGKNQSELHTLLVASAVFFSNLWRTRATGWQHAGVAAVLWAYFILLSKHTSGFAYGNGDLYCAPVGVYLLLLGFLARRRMRAGQPQQPYPFYYVTGLILVMGPTLVAIHETHAQALRAALLATECVAAIFYGLAARVKAFIGVGTGFLIALIAVEAQGNVSTFAWAVYATILGLVIIASALYIERRRDSFSRWTQSVREKIKEWE